MFGRVHRFGSMFVRVHRFSRVGLGWFKQICLVEYTGLVG